MDDPIEGEIIEDIQPQLPPEYSPDEYSIASNGAIRSKANGRIVANPGGGTAAITVENASDYLRLRQDKQIAGLLDADRRLLDVSPDYWGDIAESMYDRATSSSDKYAAAAVQAGRMVGEMTGYLGSSKDGSSGPAAGRATVTVDLDQDALMEFITSRRKQQDNTNED